MALVFQPTKSILVDASPPHPDNTHYKVSVGYEIWDDLPVKILKVQMSYNGRVEGRKSPSYPFDSDDFQRVTDAASQLIMEAD
ncbi:hypothetical protein LJB86_05500 [Deltaproteobacteria bacterium OttesenSCG-928-M10]|nr:hypothetical protein [Deltaproteobacteria bacterium OttesenSCG-928-M10]